jgi:hypothetical protein
MGGACRRTAGLAAGRAALDAARAARRLDAGASGRVVLHGHSEGGHGVGHFDVMEVASTDMVGWTGERLAGRPARSTCRP